MMVSIKPFLAILVSIMAGVLILLTPEKKVKLRNILVLSSALIKFLIVFSMLPFILNKQSIEFSFLQISPDLYLKLKVDALGLFFGLLASFLWLITSIYSIGYCSALSEHSQKRFFFCFTICLSATMGIAFAQNLLTFFIFYEILTVATYPLVVHKQGEEAIKAGRKYLTYTLTGGVFLLFSIALTYTITKDLSFTIGGIPQLNSASPLLLHLLFVTFIIGCGVKSSIAPLHSWLPTAMIAPVPVSALLHAVAVVKSGVFGCLRIIYFVFGSELLQKQGLGLWLAYFVSLTIITGSLYALATDNLKRRLAFSTVSQLSYILLGGALLVEKSLFGSIIHFAGHSFMKITLFFCAGAIYIKTHKENISELDGIGRQMPVTMLAFSICAMGLAGIPPALGFLSKWYLAIGTIQAHHIFFLFILLLSGFLNVAYFFPIIYRAFFIENQSTNNGEKITNWIIIPLVITAIMALTLGIYPDFAFQFFKLATLIATGVR